MRKKGQHSYLQEKGRWASRQARGAWEKKTTTKKRRAPTRGTRLRPVDALKLVGYERYSKTGILERSKRPVNHGGQDQDWVN